MYPAVERYLTILNKLGIHEEKGSSIEVSTDELALILFCTTRNVKIIIKKLVDEGLIEWQAGRGRGNLSKLTFLAEKEPLLMEWAQELSRKGEYKQAFDLLQTYSQSAEVKDRFVHWLNSHFGYEAEQKEGNSVVDTLRFPVYCPINTLDPSEVRFSFDSHMIRQVFDRLVEYDSVSGRVIPSIAHSWESNPDATEWTFYLRKGIRFHHGRELTSEDVHFTLERLRGNRPHNWLVRYVKQMECIGNRTIRIVLDKPNHIFLNYLCSSAMSILPKDLMLKDEEQFWNFPIGSGPFQLFQWTECCFEMTANPYYYQGRAHLDRVVIAIMPEDTASLSSNANWRQLISDHRTKDTVSDRDWKSIESLWRGCTLISWNLRKQGPQQSLHFRLAFELLLDRMKQIRDLGGDRSYPARGFRPTERTPYEESSSNPEEAKRLLREAGYEGATIQLLTYGSHVADAIWIQERCAEFGITVIVHTEDNVCTSEGKGDMDCILHGMVFGDDEVCEIENYEQIGNSLRDYLHPTMLEWVEIEVEKVLACKQKEQRRQLMDGIEQKLREEAHLLFLLHKKINTQIHPAVNGVGITSLGWIEFKKIWLENPASVS
ncbi:ABC transporter substrate-binding protein [Cohnella silvisoli]|uniref:ABC transporter substrate-binding protein n=1 Tax=Cohnella silvisoli TaxID=2873699 RepID=A0ABV1KY10_9BACL|nr:ABC transporter substrate-binding protein [Cohnella silvisoli]MCD9021825.1 SgrR family transcriptional regulator [Cohnella silvisoli]